MVHSPFKYTLEKVNGDFHDSHLPVSYDPRHSSTNAMQGCCRGFCCSSGERPAPRHSFQMPVKNSFIHIEPQKVGLRRVRSLNDLNCSPREWLPKAGRQAKRTNYFWLSLLCAASKDEVMLSRIRALPFLMDFLAAYTSNFQFEHACLFLITASQSRYWSVVLCIGMKLKSLQPRWDPIDWLVPSSKRFTLLHLFPDTARTSKLLNEAARRHTVQLEALEQLPVLEHGMCAQRNRSTDRDSDSASDGESMRTLSTFEDQTTNRSQDLELSPRGSPTTTHWDNNKAGLRTGVNKMVAAPRKQKRGGRHLPPPPPSSSSLLQCDDPPHHGGVPSLYPGARLVDPVARRAHDLGSLPASSIHAQQQQQQHSTRGQQQQPFFHTSSRSTSRDSSSIHACGSTPDAGPTHSMLYPPPTMHASYAVHAASSLNPSSTGVCPTTYRSNLQQQQQQHPDEVHHNTCGSISTFAAHANSGVVGGGRHPRQHGGALKGEDEWTQVENYYSTGTMDGCGGHGTSAANGARGAHAGDMVLIPSFPLNAHDQSVSTMVLGDSSSSAGCSTSSMMVNLDRDQTTAALHVNTSPLHHELSENLQQHHYFGMDADDDKMARGEDPEKGENNSPEKGEKKSRHAASAHRGLTAPDLLAQNQEQIAAGCTAPQAHGGGGWARNECGTLVPANGRFTREDKPEWLPDGVTLMIKNLSNVYTPRELLEDLHHKGVPQSSLDFFYLPMDFHQKANLGYAFVNIKEEALDHVLTALDCRYFGRHWTRKTIAVTKARRQGLWNNCIHFLNKGAKKIGNPVYRPQIFQFNRRTALSDENLLQFVQRLDQLRSLEDRNVGMI